MQFKTSARVLTAACAFMTALGVFAGFPVNADSIITQVDLTPQQTLALYGNTIQGTYWTGADYQACTFTFYDTYTPSSDLIFDDSSYISSSVQTYISQRKYLIYYMDSVGVNTDSVISPDSRITLQLSPSVSISGITYFRQFVGYSIGQEVSSPSTRFPAYYYSYNFISNSVSYSATPINSSLYTWSYDPTRYVWWSTFLSSPVRVNWSFFDVYLQNVEQPSGVEQTFDYTGQEINISGIKNTEFSGADGVQKRYYIILSCPRVTDGYVLPQPETTTPDYSGQLSDIYDGIGANTTLLQAILARLDLIYQRMAQNELPNPDLDSASTIPRDLQQYYSGIASGAPSASAINDLSGGAAIIPFSGLLSASGMGSLFGLLVGIACAGWVLTRGRGG